MSGMSPLAGPPPLADPGPGDLFDMLLPMLTIYQEYVRNHHYSLQVPHTNTPNTPLGSSFYILV